MIDEIEDESRTEGAERHIGRVEAIDQIDILWRCRAANRDAVGIPQGGRGEHHGLFEIAAATLGYVAQKVIGEPRALGGAADIDGGRHQFQFRPFESPLRLGRGSRLGVRRHL